MRVHHGNLVPIGDYVCGSRGDFGPAPLSAAPTLVGSRLYLRDRKKKMRGLDLS